MPQCRTHKNSSWVRPKKLFQWGRKSLSHICCCCCSKTCRMANLFRQKMLLKCCKLFWSRNSMFTVTWFHFRVEDNLLSILAWLGRKHELICNGMEVLNTSFMLRNMFDYYSYGWLLARFSQLFLLKLLGQFLVASFHQNIWTKLTQNCNRSNL